MLNSSQSPLLEELIDRAESRQQHINLIDALNQSVDEVFDMMCGLTFDDRSEPIDGCPPERLEVSGVISISGEVEAIVVANFSRKLAFNSTETILGDLPEEVDSDVLETVAELTNMIGGSAKDQLKVSGCNLGLPTVVHGAGHVVTMPRNSKITSVQLESAQGKLNIEVGLPPKR